MTGYAGSRDYVWTPQSPQKTPHRSRHPTEKQSPTFLQELCAGCELFKAIQVPPTQFRDPAYPVIYIINLYNYICRTRSQSWDTDRGNVYGA